MLKDTAELVRYSFHYLPSFQASNGIRLLKIGDNVEMWGQGVVRSADILSKCVEYWPTDTSPPFPLLELKSW